MANIECTMYACPVQANQVLARALRGLDLLLSIRSTEQGTLFSGCRRRRWVVQDCDRALGLGESLPLLVPLASQCTPPSHSSASTPSAIAIHRRIHAAQPSAGHPL